jgi:hypothetical protein
MFPQIDNPPSGFSSAKSPEGGRFAAANRLTRV